MKESLLLLLGVLLLSINILFAQESISEYHLGLSNSYKYNPAESKEENAVMSILVPLSNVNVSSYSTYDISKITENKKSDLVGLLSTLKKDDYYTLSARLNLLDVGIKFRKTYMRFFSSYRIYTQIYYPVGIISLLTGDLNEYNLDESFETKLRANVLSYGEFGLGVTRALGTTGFTVGMNLKLLYGHMYMNIKSASSKITLISSPEVYSLKMSFSSPGSVITPLNDGGTGVGVDLGVTYDFSQKFELPIIIKFAISDLGFISWKTPIKQNIENKEIKINNISDIIDKDWYSELGLNELIQTSSMSLITYTPAQILLSGTYTLNKIHRFNITTFNRLMPIRGVANTTALGYGIHLFNDNLVFNINGIKLPTDKFALGLGTKAKLGFMQFYLSMDTASDFSLSLIKNITSLNVNTGLIVSIGGGRKNKNNNL